MSPSVRYHTTRNYLNQNKGIFPGVGEYDIPVLAPEYRIPSEWIGFNYSMRFRKPEGAGCHFFIDDYHFERLWAQPDTYLNRLRSFACVCTPDFSIYRDFPLAAQIFNHFRKHWLGAYWQQCGITVIPTIAWGDERSFSWCFDGEPVGGCVAVSSVGCMNDSVARALFLAGYREMMDRLQPERILFHGTVPTECTGNIVPLRPFTSRFKEDIGRGG